MSDEYDFDGDGREELFAFPTSFAQQRLWFIDQLLPGGFAYNMPLGIRLKGALDARALERAFDEIVRRHEVLRTTFEVVDGEPMQIVHPFLPAGMPQADLTALSEGDAEAEAERIAAEETRRPFDLSAGPMMRSLLVRLRADDHLLVLTTHHIVFDGSHEIFLRELSALYEAFSRGEDSPLPEPPIQYGDYAVWQREWLQGETLEEMLAYWRLKLGGSLPVLQLPTDRPRPAVQTFSGSRRSVVFPAELSGAIRDLAARSETTLFTLMLAALKVLFHRYAKQDDIIVGSPVSTRTQEETERLIGCFVNTLVLRTDLSGDPTFRELLGRVRETTLEAFSHQGVPFERLVEELNLERALSHQPLFQVMFVFIHSQLSELKVSGLEAASLGVNKGRSRFDMLFSAWQSERQINVSVEYNTDLFDDSTVARMLSHLRALLDAVTANPDLPLARVPLLSDDERRRIVVEWNDTRRDYRRDVCLHDLFELQAEKTPDAVAVVSGGERLTYGELNRQANQLARRLKEAGNSAGDFVAVYLERGAEVVPALLGILKSGAAYVPLEPSFPEARVRWILSSLRVRTIVTQGSKLAAVRGMLESLPALEHVILMDDAGDESARELEAVEGARPGARVCGRSLWGRLPWTNLPVQSCPEDLAYVIFTSGSTGTPKGVMVQHRAVVNLIEWVNRTFRVNSSDRVLFVTSLCFDLSVYDIFGLLAAGGSIHVASGEDVHDPESLLRTLMDGEITFWDSAPAVLQQLTPFFQSAGEGAARSRLRLAFLSGDWIPVTLPDAVRERFPAAEVISLGGATEAAVWSNYYPVGVVEPHWVSIPYGKPIQNSRYYILDAHLEPCPVGVSGDLYIAGDCLAIGYADEPGLTAQKFIPDPFGREPGSRLYRTGDLARYFADGQIEFLGRVDHQVKIRGFRIELGEIETTLSQHPGVREAAVVVHESATGDRQLIAYLSVEDAEPPTSNQLHGYLKERLPEYMIPSAFVTLDSLPLTPNGKLDRKALPAPEMSAPDNEFIAPRTPVEELIAGVWSEVLGAGHVGVRNNFFELGGHSLLATQVVSRLREAFAVELPLRALFESPTVEGLAVEVERALRGVEGVEPSAAPLSRATRRDGELLPLSYAQQRLWFLSRLEPDSPFYNIAGAVRLRGALDADALGRALGEVVARHEVLRTRIVEVDGEPWQEVCAASEFVLESEDLLHPAEVEREAQARRLAEDEARRPFDLGGGRLLRAKLVSLSEVEHLLLLTLHHIASDGWSLGVLAGELGSLYGSFAGGGESTLAEPPVQYADYALWQREWLEGERLERQLAYWRERLAGAPPALELPTDRPRPAAQGFRGARFGIALPAGLTESLRSVARVHDSTLFMLLLAAFQSLLARYTGQGDICVGTPVAGRTRPELEGLIGFFVNTLVLRTELSDDPSFVELLGRVREACLGGYAHQDVPFEKLVEELRPQRDMSRQPLFQVMLAFQGARGGEGLRLGGIEAELMAGEAATAKFDLTLSLREAGGGLVGWLEYDTDLFDAATIARMAEHFTRLLEGAGADPSSRVSRLPLLGEDERRLIVEGFNPSRREYERGLCIHELFEHQAARTPDAVAVEYEDERLTYAELNERADRVARSLRRMGVGAESRVGVLLERSINLVVGLLGVLKAGAAYVPLDPEYPHERLRFMLEDSGAGVLLTQSWLLDSAPDVGARVLCIDGSEAEVDAGGAPTQSRVVSDNLAYVIYTSGSTGRPKGVAISHESAVSLLRWAHDAFAGGELARVFASTSVCFDLSVFELFAPLTCGGSVVLARDALRLADAGAAKASVTLVNTVPSAMAELARAGALHAGVRVVNLAGEALSRELVEEVYAKAESVTVWNLYGPTEDTTYSTAGPVERGAGRRVTVGRPVAGSRVYILDAAMEPTPVGVSGELYLGGEGLARGYLGRPGLTAERFVPDPLGIEQGGRLYRTGDLARFLPSGEIEYLGRADQQVKVRGFRIELGEVEAAIRSHEGVRDCCVVASGDGGGRRLVAYVVGERGREVGAAKLRESLRASLPEYMVPSAFVALESLPLTPNGKLDRKALPEPTPDGVRADVEDAAPRTVVEEVVAGIWSEVLGVGQVGVNDNFFDLGGHSLLLTRVYSRLRESFDVELSLIELFKCPTVHSLSQLISRKLSPEDAGTAASGADAGPRATIAEGMSSTAGRAFDEVVAVIGMSGRFPGAGDVEEFWGNLRDGVESISHFSEEELRAAGVSQEVLSSTGYVKAKGVLDDVEGFDAAFFGINPNEAEVMDPQHRLFLECAWHALEDAGYDPAGCPGRVGVYAGQSMNTYAFNLFSNYDLIRSRGGLQVLIGNDKDFLSTRVSYKLNLRGPSVAVQTACSTSLVAVTLACQSLLNGQCDVALAGGVSVGVPHRSGYFYQEEGILSPDGHCRAFDAKARGTVSGNGVGVVVLKRLSEALADGDEVRAVIKGFALNNDGSLKVGYTAPSVEGQAGVIAEAHRAAGVAPETITYVEAHGTGTRLGDPIEVAALTEVFGAGTRETNSCAVGSVKTNIGHLDAAAGVAGLIKTVQALRHKLIPPSLHFNEPNPQIDFRTGPFYVNARLREWETNGTPRRAGVSSFGIGGTNAHVVLEEAPDAGPHAPARGPQLLVLSAKTAAALEAATANLIAHLKRNPGLSLADVCYTLQVGRGTFNHRRALVCRTVDEAVAALEAADEKRVLTRLTEKGARPVAFMFSGQGSQYAGMGAELYRGEPVFRRYLDACAELFLPHLGRDLRELLYGEERSREDAAAELRRTSMAQPALFAVEYALARMWMSWGLKPQAFVGHSIGEYVAACLAGVFSLADAARLVAARGRLMQELPGGAMLAVPLSEPEAGALLGASLSLAAVNAPELCVVSGPSEEVERLRLRLEARGIVCRPLHTSHAFHSEMMEPAVSRFVEEVREVGLGVPRVGFVSNVTGSWITAEEATDPAYWGRHLRHTVRFAEGLRRLCEGFDGALVEVGPGETLSTFAKHLKAEGGVRAVVSSLPRPDGAGAEAEHALDALARLWLAGVDVDWRELHAGEQRRRVSLPGYPFEHRRYWVEARANGFKRRSAVAAHAKNEGMDEWFHAPVWKHSVPPEPADGATRTASHFVIFADRLGLGSRLGERLGRDGHLVTYVTPGASFDAAGDGDYTLNPRRGDDYFALLGELRATTPAPTRFVHLWGVTSEAAPESFEEIREAGFDSLIHLTQALAERVGPERLRLVAVTSDAFRVTGREHTRPEKAILSGACRVIPQEHANVTCRHIDLALPTDAGEDDDWPVDDLIAELEDEEAGEAVVAYRGGRRWAQGFEALRLKARAGTPSRLRPRGVYLVTGGLGDIGLELAGYLARTTRARLALLGRSAMPPREAWDDWLATHGGESEVGRKLLKIRAMEEAGAEVLLLRADVSDERQLSAAVAQTLRSFGEINGVIHAAGVADGGLTRLRRPEDVAPVMAAKVKGTLLLEGLLKEQCLDFFVLCSSVTSILGGVGQVAYCAANAFLDAFAQDRFSRDGAAVSINWDAWGEIGMAVKTAVPEALRARRDERLKHGIRTAEGVEAFARVLRRGLPQVVVSPRDFAALVEELKLRGHDDDGRGREETSDADAGERAAVSRHPRPILDTSYVEPATELERRICDMWQELLGIERVGTRDNFIELGGHSLLATRLCSQLRAAFQVEVPLRAVYERATASELADEIEQLIAAKIESLSDEEARRLLESAS